ncbi:hypothetical protein H4219_002427 [Mycoemilia scoparia]|uniref:CRAL-TRIO domain-containing protein n=1 Tax=Mycoemilia scoparia TaxID=417184 RepID=A0A9W7ZXN0_9FUNG|nr:hypothetical protein H4219_002427 [Mycoemilia scoparia]
MVDLDNPDPQERADVIARFREALDKENSDASAYCDDSTLWRFAVARKLDIPKAMEMITGWYKWRQDEKIDNLPLARSDNNLSVPYPIRGYTGLNDANLMPGNGIKDYLLRTNQYFGGGCWHKFDKEGHPVYIERIGRYSAKQIPKHCASSEVLEMHYIFQEFLTQVLLKECSKKAGHEIDKQVVIFDCTGLSLGMLHWPALNMLQELLSSDQLYYPERMYKTYLVNAPSMFVTAWNIVKSWLDPRVISKVTIMNKNFKDALLEQIPAENLPKFLGGECTCSHMPGGCVPCPPIHNYVNLPRSAFSGMPHHAELNFSDTSHVFKFKTPPRDPTVIDAKDTPKSLTNSGPNNSSYIGNFSAKGWLSFGKNQTPTKPRPPPVAICSFEMTSGRGVVVEVRFKPIGTTSSEELLYPETLFDAFRAPVMIEIHLPKDQPEGTLIFTWRVPRFDEGEAPFPTEEESKVPQTLRYSVDMEEKLLHMYDLPNVNRDLNKPKSSQ